MSTDDPYLPPATELREDLAPRRYQHVLVGGVLAYATTLGFLLALDATLDLRTRSFAIGSAVGVAILMLQFRQLSWKLVALIAPPSALAILVLLAYLASAFF